MIFIMYWPIIESVGWYTLRLFTRLLDSGCSTDPYKTKKTSIKAYLDLHEGPVYHMHYKYSALLTIVFVTMMYGFGIPILFPIGALAMIIIYIIEKTMLCYAYSLPPMYDERLSQSVLTELYGAPLIFLSFGYWMASNKQMFSNDHLVPFNRMNSPLTHHHTIDRFMEGDFQDNPAWPMLLVLAFLILNYFIGDWTMNKL